MAITKDQARGAIAHALDETKALCLADPLPRYSGTLNSFQYVGHPIEFSDDSKNQYHGYVFALVSLDAQLIQQVGEAIHALTMKEQK